ncbi:MAG TPA: tRNA (guanosine(46)-N7)-methyltransferase TrmB, partial [Saprospiraceae bacterium]|nr:tRNA (guanosine(46)-N7)-methyltransferase TrmB [Saprospiraceae bacterium]
MGRKNKLRKFAEILSFPNVYECYDFQQPTLVGPDMQAVDLKGRWQAEHFKNTHPITLELACGGGEYTVALAQRYPERNFIGVDIKGNRIWKGAKDALAKNLPNAAFLRTRIEIIDRFIAPGEVDEIWITFPDPFPRPSKENRRLTSAFFLEKYRSILRPGGLVQLKHDDPDFYQFTLENLRYFAVLKAMGTRSRTLVMMVLLQALVVGLIGFGIGIGLVGAFALTGRRPGAELT